MDYAHVYTDKQIEKLQHEIEIVYKRAEIDIRHKMEDFEKKYRVKENIYKKEVKQGKITQEQFDNWKKGQVFQREQWKAKHDSILDTMHNANQTAVKIINGQTTNVFAVNANYISYSIEREAGINFGFGIYDSATVVNLIKENPQILPKWRIDKPKDYSWSHKKVNRAITQGIIQGESIQQIADRLSNKLVSSNKNKMLTFARTAMTGAQNSGRLTSMKAAKDLGIDLEKEWLATLDSHTRDSHASIDGERVSVDSKFSNGLDYPGDPGGAPSEVYNCRCTMVSNVKKYSSVYSRRDNETGKVLNKLGPDTVANLSYKDWVTTKNVMKKARSAEETEKISDTLLKASALGSGTVNYQVGSNTSFDFKYKGFDSLFRKITTKSASKGITKEQYAEKITDALRFTNLSPAETLTQDYFTIVGELESQGYKMIEVSNTFIDYTSYRGINTLVQSPKGYVFELQFHTPQSMEIKEINHKLYEEERKLDKVKDAQKIKKIISTENENAKSIITPLDVEQIKNIG